MKELDHNDNLKKVFKSLNKKTFKLSARESNVVEFKENFNWGSKDKYARSMAAFANNNGGYLIFGIKDEPRELKGLQSNNFQGLDEADITSYLNNLFSPEIYWEKFTSNFMGKTVGVIYTHRAVDKPIVAIKNDGDIKEAEIYYRYNGRSEKIKYPELKNLFLSIREQERKSWMRIFEKISKIGPSNAAVMDVINGTIEGENNSLLIDEKLIPKLKFIKKGNFSKSGKPTLKLIGDISPVAITKYNPGKSEFRLTKDPSAISVREETILEAYPLSYVALVKKLTSRYSDFKTNSEFYNIKRKLMQNDKYCRSRYLDPNNKKSAKKDFYNLKIFKEFDKHYKKRK